MASESTPSALRLPCASCAKHAASDANFSCSIDKKSSNKCFHCRSQKSKCLPLLASLHCRARRLQRLQRLLRERPGSEDRQSHLLLAIFAASNGIKDRAEALARAAAAPKTAEDVSRALLAEQKKTNAFLAKVIVLLRAAVRPSGGEEQENDEDEDDDEDEDEEEFSSEEEEDDE